MFTRFLQLKGILATYRERIRLFHPDVRRFILGQFLVGLGMTSWSLFFNLLLHARGFDKAAIGSTLAVGNLAIGIFAFPAGLLVGRISHRKLLVVSQTLNLLCLICALFCENSLLLWMSFFIGSGFGASARITAGPLIMSRSTNLERTYIFSINFIVGYTGAILGNFFAGALVKGIALFSLGEINNYRIAILIGLCVSLTGLVPFLSITSEASAKRDSLSLFNMQILKKIRWKMVLSMVFPPTLISIGAGLIVQFMNLYFKDVFHLADEVIGILMSLQAATMAFGVLCAPLLSERIGKINTIVITEALSLPFMVIMGLTNNAWAAGFCFVMRAALMNMSAPISSTLALELCSVEERGIENALQTVSWSIAWAVAAWIYGHLLKGNYSFSFFLAAVLYATAGASYLLIFTRLQKKQSEEALKETPAADAQLADT